MNDVITLKQWVSVDRTELVTRTLQVGGIRSSFLSKTNQADSTLLRSKGANPIFRAKERKH